MKLMYYISKIIKKLHVPAIARSKIDRTAKICSGSHVVNTIIGRYSYIGSFCAVINAEVGSFCSIADNCIIGGASHPIDWVSTSPVFHKGENILNNNFSKHEYDPYKLTVIGNDVWIGNNCLIKSGVRIGNGAVIGMGSVVTKNVGEYEIWAGNPARLIRKRFNDDIIAELLKVKWWEFDNDKLSQYAKYFNDVKKFLEEINSGITE